MVEKNELVKTKVLQKDPAMALVMAKLQTQPPPKLVSVQAQVQGTRVPKGNGQFSSPSFPSKTTTTTTDEKM